MPQYAASSSEAGSPNLGDAHLAPAGPPASHSAGATSGGPAGGVQHKRVYQACIPCRRRKVRCDLGSVDNPHDPPCVRCRRESKECYFSATRRKRKADDAIDDSLGDFEHDEYIVRNGRKRLNAADSPPVASLDRRLYSEAPLTPGGSQGRSQPLRRPGERTSDWSPPPAVSDGARQNDFSGEPNQPLENLEAQQVMRKEVYGPHDALDLLYKAATDNPSHQREPTHTPVNSTSQPSGLHAHLESSSRKLSQTRDRPYNDVRTSRQDITLDQPIDPELTKSDPSAEPGYAEALKAWNRFRFVRAGWFSASEAIDYIHYYYEYLSPLTPISPPTFQKPASHVTLLTEEPILTVTLLTIASRYKRISGAGGHCRSHAIHEQLWNYLRGMIERVVWGQEAFGGALGSSGTEDGQSSSTAPWRGLRRGSLRTLGTIESLMILTEWHPRALHFPPNEAIDELLLPPYDAPPEIAMDEDGNQRPSFGGKRIESWLEPAWRSDRMCWMLLSTGVGLAYELGVFDDIHEMLATGSIARPEYEEEPYRLRAERSKKLLLIYLTQLAGRLGWTSMVPESLRRSDSVVSRRRPLSVEGGHTPGTNLTSLSNSFNYIPDLELDDQIIHCWAGISNAMHIGNEKLFRSRKHTTDIIQSGKYTVLLKDFQPMLKDWWKEFERFPLPTHIRHILTIEYEYVRIYINSLSLQAVVERCTSNAGGGTAPGGSVTGASAAQLSPQTQNYYGKLPLGQLGGFGAEDQEYVKEVINGSRNLLRTVVEGLLPGDYLKHAPVRTYFRIISGAMFLLKTFALGAPRSDVEISIQLMDRAVDALRTCVVDDVHLGSRFADLLDSLTKRLRNRFIHAPPAALSTTDGRSPGPSHTEALNGTGVNGHGTTHQVKGPESWAKLREGVLGTERSSTPANISATPFDVASGTFPYPSGSASMFGPSTPAPGLADNSNPGGISNNQVNGLFDSSDWNNPNNEMWYLPPGAAFFQNMDNTNVAMTDQGIHVGGLDLLEYMAMDPMDGQFGVGMDGNNF